MTQVEKDTELNIAIGSLADVQSEIADLNVRIAKLQAKLASRKQEELLLINKIKELKEA